MLKTLICLKRPLRKVLPSELKRIFGKSMAESIGFQSSFKQIHTGGRINYNPYGKQK